MVLKEIKDKNVINLNPTFIFYELSSIFSNDSGICVFINIILLGFAIAIIYCFFEVEIIFIYRLLLKNIDKTDKEKEKEKEYSDKIDNIFKSKVLCIDGVPMIEKSDGSRIDPKNLNNGKIGKVPFCQDTVL